MKKLIFVLSLFILFVGCVALNKEACYKEPKELNQRIAREKLTFPRGNKYAVLISGQTEERHGKNLSLAYQVLLESGFLKNNIYVLDYRGEKTAYYPVDDRANPASIKAVFEHLEKRIGPDDLFLVYATDHGDIEERAIRINGRKNRRAVSVLGLLEKNMDEVEFASYVNRINPRIGIFIFVQCYGGGFADRLAQSGRITIAASVKMSDGFAFSQPFFGAFRDGRADKNGDGRISVQEAFGYAVCNGGQNKPYGSQKPLIRNGVGREVFLDD